MPLKGKQMMYNQKMAVAIKTKGRVLREFKDTVLLPFSSEYSILLKNLNTVRAVVNVYIDGENVVPGGLVLQSGQEVDLERSIKNGNLSEGNRFKFIERTGTVEKHRGIKLEDGIVRVEYQFEHVYKPLYLAGSWSTGHDPNILRSTSISTAEYSSTVITNNMTVASTTSFAANDAGITVPGSYSDQKFQTSNWFPTETEKHTIILKLLGETGDNRLVTKSVTVKHKPKCQTCGKLNKATAKFCTECGTALEIFA